MTRYLHLLQVSPDVLRDVEPSITTLSAVASVAGQVMDSVTTLSAVASVAG